jgi:hypothetical protein
MAEGPNWILASWISIRVRLEEWKNGIDALGQMQRMETDGGGLVQKDKRSVFFARAVGNRERQLQQLASDTHEETRRVSSNGGGGAQRAQRQDD